MKSRSKPRNLNDFAAVSCKILRTGPRNLAKFSAENCGVGPKNDRNTDKSDNDVNKENDSLFLIHMVNTIITIMVIWLTDMGHYLQFRLMQKL